jgi:hypothetical protein
MATILQQIPIVKQHQNHIRKASSLLEQSQKLSEANKRSRTPLLSMLPHCAIRSPARKYMPWRPIPKLSTSFT